MQIRNFVNAILAERSIIISSSKGVRQLKLSKSHYIVFFIIILTGFLYLCISLINIKIKTDGLRNIYHEKEKLEIVNTELTNNINSLSTEITHINDYLSVLGKDIGGKRESLQEKIKISDKKNPKPAQIPYKTNDNLEIIKANMSEAFSKINDRQNYLIRIAKHVAPFSPIAKASAPNMDTYYNGNLELHKASLVTDLKNAINIERSILYLPVAPPIYNYRITSSMGKRLNPVTRKVTMHHGIDLTAQIGAPILAAGSGKVKFAGRQSGYGNIIEIAHGNSISTKYAHLQKILVKVGDKINIGDKIGLEGNTGCSSGPHLHYEVLFAGKSQNPYHFISATNNVKHQTAKK